MAYASIIDHHELVYNDIYANATFRNAAVGGIYGPPGLPLEWTPDRGRTAVFLGGDFMQNLEVPSVESSYRLYFYGSDDVDCRAFYNIFYNQFHRKGKRFIAITGGNGLVNLSYQLSGPTNFTDPNTSWSYISCNWMWIMAEGVI